MHRYHTNPCRTLKFSFCLPCAFPRVLCLRWCLIELLREEEVDLIVNAHRWPHQSMVVLSLSKTKWVSIFLRPSVFDQRTALPPKERNPLAILCLRSQQKISPISLAQCKIHCPLLLSPTMLHCIASTMGCRSMGPGLCRQHRAIRLRGVLALLVPFGARTSQSKSSPLAVDPAKV